MAQSLFATGIPFMGRGTEEDHDKFLAEMKAVMSVSAGLRRFGSAALDLAYVAAGRFDGFWESGLQPWDMAAGVLIVREAGGLVSDLSGRDHMLETGSIIAANPNLQQDLRTLVTRA